MVSVIHCKIAGCQARAWHGTLCNLHAFELHKGKRRPTAAERLQRGKALLQQRARELGVEIVSTAAPVSVRHRMRSPVA